MTYQDPNSGAVPQPGGVVYRPYVEDEEPKTPAQDVEEQAQAAIAGEPPYDNFDAGVDPDSVDEAADQDAADSEESEEDSAPAKSASKGDWVDYAVSQGADREEAESSTKEQLIEAYGA